MKYSKQSTTRDRQPTGHGFGGCIRSTGRYWKAALIFWIVGIWFANQPVSALDMVDRIVAVVNDEIISLYELDQAFQPILLKIRASNYSAAQEQQLISQVRRRVLDQLIDQKLTDQELKRHDVTVSDQELDFSIERLKESQSLNDEQFEQALATENMTMSEFREKTRAQLLRVKLVNREIKSKIVITRDEIEAYYKANIKEFGGHVKYYLRNIVMLPPDYATDEDYQQVKTEMEEIKKKLEQGQSFESLARLYSQAPTASDGGELGGFDLDELSSELQMELSKLKTGEHTPVMETDFGFQIVLVERIDQKPAKSIEEVEEQIFEKLSQEIVDNKYKDWLQDLRSRSHIKIVN